MKKIKFLQLCLGFFFLFSSCTWIQNQEINKENSSNKKIKLIASNAELLISQNKILSNLKTSSRSATIDTSNIFKDSDLSNDDLVELTNFSNSPRYLGLAVCLSGIGCMGTLIDRWSCSPQYLLY